jgi:hypothetical protein
MMFYSAGKECQPTSGGTGRDIAPNRFGAGGNPGSFHPAEEVIPQPFN